MNLKHIILVFSLIVAFFHCSSVRVKPNSNHYLNGRWLLELNIDGITLGKTIMDFEVEREKFSAYARKNADREILGFWASFFARLFTDKFEGGTLLRIVEGEIIDIGDTTRLLGILKMPMGSYNLEGVLANGVLTGELRDNNQKNRGTIKGTKEIPQIPISNYPSIISDVFRITRENIYDKSLTETKDWKKFEERITKIAGKAQDDLEMMFAFYYYSGKLPFSHYYLYKSTPGQDSAGVEKPTKKFAFIEEKSPKTAYLEITSFIGPAEEIDSVFAIIIKRDYENLIIDLRKNPIHLLL